MTPLANNRHFDALAPVKDDFEYHCPVCRLHGIILSAAMSPTQVPRCHVATLPVDMRSQIIVMASLSMQISARDTGAAVPVVALHTMRMQST